MIDPQSGRFVYSNAEFSTLDFTDEDGNPVTITPQPFPGQPGAPAKMNPVTSYEDDLHRLAMSPDASPTVQGLAAKVQMQRRTRRR